VRVRTREQGFTLIEIGVVMLIIAIMIAMSVIHFRGAKRATQYKTAQAAATTYAEAIEAYMADNGQQAPVMGSAAWPTGSREDRIGGPVDSMLLEGGKPKRYMPRAAPEAVSDGMVDLVAAGGSPAGSAPAVIRYTSAGGTYTLRVEMTEGADSTPPCVVTNAPNPPSGVQKCA
jgi:prepilin-type N-terminal cleavage/methylation domain-containing protein